MGIVEERAEEIELMAIDFVRNHVGQEANYEALIAAQIGNLTNEEHALFRKICLADAILGANSIETMKQLMSYPDATAYAMEKNASSILFKLIQNNEAALFEQIQNDKASMPYFEQFMKDLAEYRMANKGKYPDQAMGAWLKNHILDFEDQMNKMEIALKEGEKIKDYNKHVNRKQHIKDIPDDSEQIYQVEVKQDIDDAIKVLDTTYGSKINEQSEKQITNEIVEYLKEAYDRNPVMVNGSPVSFDYTAKIDDQGKPIQDEKFTGLLKDFNHAAYRLLVLDEKSPWLSDHAKGGIYVDDKKRIFEMWLAIQDMTNLAEKENAKILFAWMLQDIQRAKSGSGLDSPDCGNGVRTRQAQVLPAIGLGAKKPVTTRNIDVKIEMEILYKLIGDKLKNTDMATIDKLINAMDDKAYGCDDPDDPDELKAYEESIAFIDNFLRLSENELSAFHQSCVDEFGKEALSQGVPKIQDPSLYDTYDDYIAYRIGDLATHASDLVYELLNKRKQLLVSKAETQVAAKATSVVQTQVENPQSVKSNESQKRSYQQLNEDKSKELIDLISHKIDELVKLCSSALQTCKKNETFVQAHQTPLKHIEETQNNLSDLKKALSEKSTINRSDVETFLNINNACLKNVPEPTMSGSEKRKINSLRNNVYRASDLVKFTYELAASPKAKRKKAANKR